MNYGVGIDLGTTRCCVAIQDNNGHMKIVPNDMGKNTTPSCVFFGETSVLVGESALSAPRVGKNLIYDAKRIIGRQYEDAAVTKDRRLWSFDVVRESKPPDDSFYGGDDINSAVIAHPAYFDTKQKRETEKAAKLAGFENVKLISEPTAAAVAFGMKTLHENKTILIYDLGGGTFDVSIGKIVNEQLDILAVHGLPHLGGEDFDTAIVDDFTKSFEEAHGILFPIEDSTQIRRLRNEARVAKENMSGMILPQTIEMSVTINGKSYQHTYKIDRKRFNELCNNYFESTMGVVDETLAKANLNISQINDVLMVGGSTRIPQIKELVRAKFPKANIMNNINPDEAVAIGAAILASQMDPNKPLPNEPLPSRNDIPNIGKQRTYAASHMELDIREAVPLSIGMELRGGIVKVVIPRGTTYPCEPQRLETVTVVDNQQRFEADIYEGERARTSDNTKIGSIVMENLSPQPRGSPHTTTFEIDGNGILKVTHTEERSKRTVEFTYKYDGPRKTTADIAHFMEEAMENREADDLLQKVCAQRRVFDTYVYNESQRIEKLEMKFTKFKESLRAIIGSYDVNEVQQKFGPAPPEWRKWGSVAYFKNKLYYLGGDANRVDIEELVAIVHEANKLGSFTENENAQNADKVTRTVVNACEAAVRNVNSLIINLSNANYIIRKNDSEISIQQREEYLKPVNKFSDIANELKSLATMAEQYAESGVSIDKIEKLQRSMSEMMKKLAEAKDATPMFNNGNEMQQAINNNRLFDSNVEEGDKFEEPEESDAEKLQNIQPMQPPDFNSMKFAFLTSLSECVTSSRLPHGLAEDLLYYVFFLCMDCRKYSSSVIDQFTASEKEQLKKDLLIAILRLESNLKGTFDNPGTGKVADLCRVRSGLQFLQDEIVSQLYNLDLNTKMFILLQSEFVKEINNRLTSWKGTCEWDSDEHLDLQFIPVSHDWYLKEQRYEIIASGIMSPKTEMVAAKEKLMEETKKQHEKKMNAAKESLKKLEARLANQEQNGASEAEIRETKPKIAEQHETIEKLWLDFIGVNRWQLDAYHKDLEQCTRQIENARAVDNKRVVELENDKAPCQEDIEQYTRETEESQKQFLDNKGAAMKDEGAKEEYLKFVENAQKNLGKNTLIEQNGRIIRAVTSMDAERVFYLVAKTESTVCFSDEEDIILHFNEKFRVHPSALEQMDKDIPIINYLVQIKNLLNRKDGYRFISDTEINELVKELENDFFTRLTDEQKKYFCHLNPEEAYRLRTVVEDIDHKFNIERMQDMVTNAETIKATAENILNKQIAVIEIVKTDVNMKQLVKTDVNMKQLSEIQTTTEQVKKIQTGAIPTAEKQIADMKVATEQATEIQTEVTQAMEVRPAAMLAAVKLAEERHVEDHLREIANCIEIIKIHANAKVKEAETKAKQQKPPEKLTKARENEIRTQAYNDLSSENSTEMQNLNTKIDERIRIINSYPEGTKKYDSDLSAYYHTEKHGESTFQAYYKKLGKPIPENPMPEQIYEIYHQKMPEEIIDKKYLQFDQIAQYGQTKSNIYNMDVPYRDDFGKNVQRIYFGVTHSERIPIQDNWNYQNEPWSSDAKIASHY
ncbi:hypothetical protein WR25_00715 [Diploscapter pachys]|uniref:Uncharacterized protein n=1 Tax=Diploscapter pachys TaxID=2018661 RepID=A0A2A2LBM7_9BILA|nr:hypothetical protein WR25_00715 [Diploscapter pachys]